MVILMNWDEIFVEGYCIMNPDCKAAQLTNANTNLDVMMWLHMR